MLGALSHLSLTQARGERITLLVLLEGNLKITQLLSATRELGTSSRQPQSTACSTEDRGILARVLLTGICILFRKWPGNGRFDYSDLLIEFSEVKKKKTSGFGPQPLSQLYSFP